MRKYQLIIFIFLIFGFPNYAQKGNLFFNVGGVYNDGVGGFGEMLLSSKINKVRYETGPKLIYTTKDKTLVGWKFGVSTGSRSKSTHICTHRYEEKIPHNLISLNYHTTIDLKNSSLLLLYNHYIRLGIGWYLLPGLGYNQTLTKNNIHPLYAEVGLKWFFFRVY